MVEDQVDNKWRQGGGQIFIHTAEVSRGYLRSWQQSQQSMPGEKLWSSSEVLIKNHEPAIAVNVMCTDSEKDSASTLPYKARKF